MIIGPAFLVSIPDSLPASSYFPDFSKVFTFAFCESVVSITLVGSLESLLVSSVARLKCQRCLETFEQPLHSSSRLAFVASEDDAGNVPEGYEAIAADEGRIDLGDLVEDALLLSLPVVALHGEGTQCAGTARQAGDDDRAEAPADTHRPFAQLQDLLKH